MELGQVIIETERLILRKLTMADVDAAYVIYSDQESVKYWSEPAYTKREQAEKKVVRDIEGWDDGIYKRLAIELKNDDEFSLVGMLTIFKINENCKSAEIGYILNRKFWNKGIMSEALAAAVEYAFETLGLNRLEADIDPANKASATLLLKNNFKLEGFLREKWIVDGVKSDSEIYGLLRADANYIKRFEGYNQHQN